MNRKSLSLIRSGVDTLHGIIVGTSGLREGSYLYAAKVCSECVREIEKLEKETPDGNQNTKDES